MKGFINFITGFFATILSFVLVIALIATALVGSVSTMFTPTNLTQMIQDIDISSMILQNEDIASSFEQMGFSAESTEKLFKSNFMNEFLNAYLGDMTDALSGKPVEQSSISPEKIKEIANNNIDEIVDIFSEVIPEEEKPATDEELKEQILEMVNEQAEEIVQMLPDPKALSEMLQNPSGDSSLPSLFPGGNSNDESNITGNNAAQSRPIENSNDSAVSGNANRNGGASSSVVGSVKTNPDGTVTITYSDGTTEVVSQQGGTVNGNGEGNASGETTVVIKKSVGAKSETYNSFVTAQNDIFSVLPMLQSFLNSGITTGMIVFCLIVAALIFVLRLRKFGGLIWLGVCSLIAAVILTLITLGTSFAGSMLSELANFDVSFVLNAFKGNLSTWLIILYGCGVLFIAGFIVIKILRNKKEAAQEEPVLEPVLEPVTEANAETAELNGEAVTSEEATEEV